MTDKRRRVRPSSPGKTQFPVVGIGASAGGLEAFTQLLDALPADTGMAFVLVQHLHPGYASALTDILSRETPMPVNTVADGMPLEPNHIYVIPPGADLTLVHAKLHLVPRKEHEKTMPVDQFFRSLAVDQGTRSIGIVLSGTASDGVLGLKAIKAEGGITFAQDEATAKYHGMPDSAVAAGVVDFVLPPDRIARELTRIARHPYVARAKIGRATGEAELPASPGALEKIFLLLRSRTGHDFTFYKRSTLERRIGRRMLLHKLDKLADYARFVQEDPDEVSDLFHDMLINVTGFFRDPQAFGVLREKVFPEIARKPPGTPVRIWVPGCSTGEEVYSLAMALLEYLRAQGGTALIQIFGTDIDELAIEKARMGVYPENIIQDVGTERLEHFFTKVEAGYQISKNVRDMCIFAVQDVTKDPPFSRMDLISCRNLLIYLGPALQKRVLAIFHYALTPHGFLFLGTAESIGDMADLFATVDAKEKVFTKKSVATPHVPFGVMMEASPASAVPGAATPVGATTDIEAETDRLLMSEYLPGSLVINKHMDIIHFRGRTGPYLEPAPGRASLNLMKMARRGLIPDLHAAVLQSIRTGAVTHRSGIRLTEDGTTRNVIVEVRPMGAHDGREHYFLVVLQDAPPSQMVDADKQLSKTSAGEVKRLEEELAATKEYVQSVIEQQETTNEELRSANEEIQSSNEELQSINEELETAKEELQSSNEELATVNEELGSRAVDLEQANNDLSNLVSSLDIPIVIVGPDLRIRRFTPRAENVLHLISTDVGRPISDIRFSIEVPDLKRRVLEVIDKVQRKEYDAQDNNGHWYSVRMRPYMTRDKRVDGAVIAFIDIDTLKRSLLETKRAREYAEAVVTAVRHPMLILDNHLRVVSASKAYFDVFRVEEKATIGNLVHRLGNGQWAIPALRDKLEQAVTAGTEFHDFTVTHKFEKVGERTVSVSGRQIPAGMLDTATVLMQIECLDDPQQRTD